MKTAIYLAVLLASGIAQAEPRQQAVRNVYACQGRDYFERTVKFAAANDVNAFTKALSQGLSSGQCVMLLKGQFVYVDDVAVLAGLKQVRTVGNVTTYWTFTEAVR